MSDISPLIESGIDPKLTGLAGPSGWRLTPATLAHFITKGEWQAARHLLYISSLITSALARGNARLIVSMPPRHGKSELLSTWTPVWALERDPKTRIILSSYGSDLATDFGRKVRDIILTNEMDNGPLRTRLRKDSLQVGRFLTTSGGGMYSVGVGGPITGRGADLLLTDDYIKNAKDASSNTIREDIFDWFTSTAMTRLEPGGSAIILATRWNIDDLIGRLMTHTQEVWTHIVLPAFAEEDDPLGREVGEALWPERYSKASLNTIYDNLGTYFWQSLYQQAPIPRVAGLMQAGWISPVDILPHKSRLRFVRHWDLASTPEGGDWTVGLQMAEDLTTGIYYITDVVRGQFSPAEIETLIAATAEADGREVQVTIEQEPGSAGKIVIDHYVRNVLKGFPVRGERATGDKFIRAQPFFAAAEAGSIRIMKATWNKVLLEELELFPEAPHDDQVDGISGAFNALNNKRYRGTTWGRKPRDPKKGIPSAPGKLIQGVVFGR